MINFDDIIGRPWTEAYDCRNVTHDVLGRLGFDVPAAWLVIPCDLTPDGCTSAWADYQQSNGDGWARLGGGAADAVAVGDVIVSTTMRDRNKLHLSVLVDASRRLALTSNKEMGAHLRPADRLPCVRDVYRFRQLST